MYVRVIVLVTCLWATLPVRAQAQDPVQDIVKKMKEVFEPIRPSTAQVDLTMSTGGETIHWVARAARKEFPDGKKMVMVLLEPTEVKGNAYVMWEPKDNQLSTVWTYMPLLRRVRELIGVDVYEHFLGTDFTYASRVHPPPPAVSIGQRGGARGQASVPDRRSGAQRAGLLFPDHHLGS